MVTASPTSPCDDEQSKSRGDGEPAPPGVNDQNLVLAEGSPPSPLNLLLRRLNPWHHHPRKPAVNLASLRRNLAETRTLADQTDQALRQALQTYHHHPECPRSTQDGRKAGTPCACDQPARIRTRLQQLRSTK